MTVAASWDQLPRDELMDLIRANAEEYRPRMFAIYGIAKHLNEFLPEAPFVVWGMDFGNGSGVVAWHPDDRSSHRADNTARMLRSYQRMGEARLVWLDPDDS